MRIREELDAARCVLATSNFALALGFSEHDRNMIATAASELARNILKYAGTGEIVLREIRSDGRVGMEIVARDQGPGIEDVEMALRDHYSSGGTLGLGLSGVQRMMDEFRIDSTVGVGTTVVACKWI